MTPRSLQSEFYNSRYGLFGGTRQVRIIFRLKFAANASRTVLSPTINGISPRCTLATYKIPKLTKNIKQKNKKTKNKKTKKQNKKQKNKTKQN
jgi:hypothetical protein